MNSKKTYDLWLDSTSEPGISTWIVSLADNGNDRTLATFAKDDYADALEFAKKKSREACYPVVVVDKHGNRETIFEAHD